MSYGSCGGGGGDGGRLGGGRRWRCHPCRGGTRRRPSNPPLNAHLAAAATQADVVKFEPALPAWKSAAVQRLGFGVLDKVILRFPHNFWRSQIKDNVFFGRLQPLPAEKAPPPPPVTDNGVEDPPPHPEASGAADGGGDNGGGGAGCGDGSAIDPVTLVDDGDGGEKVGGDSLGEVRGEYFWFVDMSVVTGSPVLMALLPAAAARRLEQLEDDQVGGGRGGGGNVIERRASVAVPTRPRALWQRVTLRASSHDRVPV